jgi:hypothetical protein
MRRILVMCSLVLGVGGLAASMLRCNSVLGITAASLDSCKGTGCDLCRVYCNTVLKNCPYQGPTGFQYTEYQSTDTCLKMCDIMTDHGGPWIENAGPDASAGNSLACRMTFALAAGNPDAGGVNNCEYAGLLGGDNCVSAPTDPCSNFCAVDTIYCAPDGGFAHYASPDECMMNCTAPGETGYPYITIDGKGDLVPYYQGTNTLNCRAYHLGFAISVSQTTHCPHTLYNGYNGAGQGVCLAPAPADGGIADAGTAE